MNLHSAAVWLLEQEARSLIARLSRLRPFALITPMVPAATVPPEAQTAMENHLIEGRRSLHRKIDEFIGWLRSPRGRAATPADAQKRIVFLKLRFNSVLSQFHIFSDVLTQRSEHEMGVWIAGLDDFAADALALAGGYYRPPPVVCYVDRGHGGAIRRARTRLPGGDLNPVAIIRIPHERMVGSGVASSLVHETGHQASELLGLINPLRAVLQRQEKTRPNAAMAWRLWDRWISEILADFWGVAKVGIASTLGLISLVSLPRAFVFRIDVRDPHPAPWIRVKLSCAIGAALYPHAQWKVLAELWQELYPTNELDQKTRSLLAMLEASIPEFVQLLVHFRPKSLHGKSLLEVLPIGERQPIRLAALYQRWLKFPAEMQTASPALVFAAIGQAKADGIISPEAESKLLADLLSYWAMRSALDTSAICATQPRTHLAQQPPRLGREFSMTLN
ncbi:MAG: hypothetical protein WAK48_16255 [Candidatus Acidiferrum sp.]|jgi:hypothetical protein